MNRCDVQEKDFDQDLVKKELDVIQLQKYNGSTNLQSNSNPSVAKMMSELGPSGIF